MIYAHLVASQPAEKVVSIGFHHACSFSSHELEAPLPQGGMVPAYPYGSYDPLFGSLPDDLSRV
jgi:hypothetical protein